MLADTVELELISFKLCPFVQRALITLLYKDVPHKITYIDLADPPLWFLEISPFEKVPVLRVDQDTAIFESAVICEYIDETTPNRLHPRDPLLRALNRSWIEFGSACIMDLVYMTDTRTPQKFQYYHDELLHKFDRIEEALGVGPYFNGANFALVDAAYAPLFMRTEILRDLIQLEDADRHPRLRAWWEALLAVPAVEKSVVSDLPALYREHVRKKNGHAASLLLA